MGIRLFHEFREHCKQTRYVWLSCCTVNDDHFDQERSEDTVRLVVVGASEAGRMSDTCRGNICTENPNLGGP